MCIRDRCLGVRAREYPFDETVYSIPNIMKPRSPVPLEYERDYLTSPINDPPLDIPEPDLNNEDYDLFTLLPDEI